ncbi:translocation/assembly module TamB domain-containing protein [Azohydromonas lata]|uniref:Translocation/assembly module TamB domain-containing protein n=1 Tax=Azohydromonas lata TaxID=45677 RepID=A0ABU5IPB8_9BURK|nr:translocation/assembly module TamB domain-containing protein [Azohydromonas lata]MDZ5460747.1 translocation/assembly module TamB domain-containing protein [Azohydromonas lata]
MPNDTADAQTPPTPHAPPPAVPPTRPRRRWWLALLPALLALLAAGGAALWWALSPAGLTWWLPRAGVEIAGLRGGLQGGALAFERLRWSGRNGARLDIDQFSLGNLHWTFRPPGGWLGLTLTAPSAQRVAWTSAQTGSPPLRAPASLQLPLRLRVDSLKVATLQLDAQTVSELALSAELGAQAGRVHRLNALSLRWQQMAVSASAQLGAQAPLALQGQAQAASLEGVSPPWQAALTLDGTLAQFSARATLRSPPADSNAPATPPGGKRRALPGTPAASASLDAEARFTPFADWPLPSLQARTQGLDLSALAPALPVTALTGHADLQGGSAGTPLELDLALDNARPGRWTEHRLPLRSAQVTLAARPGRRDLLELQALGLELGDARGRAGSLSGSGRWEQSTLTLDIRARQLQLSRLDPRLPALRLDGPLAAEIAGLPLPGTAPPAAAQPLPAPLRMNLRAALSGQDENRLPLQLSASLQAQREGAPGAGTWRVEVPEFNARAGTAQAQGEGRFERDATGAWQAQSRGRLRDFTLQPWWPDAPAGTSLSGQWDAQLSAAAGAALPRTLRGQASVNLSPSRLAGVPLQGDLSWRDAGAGPRAQARLQLGGNRLQVEARAAGASATPTWSVDVDAPALAVLTPLARLHPALPALWPREGSLRGQARFQGGSARDWRSEGSLETTALAAGPWKLARAQARWSLRAPQAGDAPLSLTLDAAGLQQDGAARLDSLRARLAGRWAAHELDLQASTPLRLPAWADGLTGPSNGTDLSLRGSGAWQAGAVDRWHLQLQALQARTRGGRSTPWLSAGPVQAALQFDPALRSVALSPGALDVLGAALRWSQLEWTAPATPDAAPRLRVAAELPALRAAPWLQRLQPDFGWGGDLEIGGQLRFDSTAATAGDVVLERRRGDLSRTDELGMVESFGMTDLRLALQVQDGRWTFTQAMAARHFGVLAGAQVVQSRPGLPWPAPGDALQGVLELRVDDLGVWAPWVPPGWRLGGQLHAGAGLSGRFGAPEITGRLDASRLGLRNLLQGVELRDGEIAMALRGEDAHIERFTWRAGEGRLDVTGGATFGATPGAALKLQLERFRVLGRFDRNLSVSGQAALNLQGPRLALDGRLAVDEGFIDISRSEAPALDEDVTVLHRPHAPAGAAAVAAEPSALMRNTRVELRLDLGQRLRLRGQGMDTRLAGEVLITTPGGRPQVAGTVRTLQGRYAAYGQEMEIRRGEIVFTGAPANPRLDILAIRPKLDEVQVGVQIVGTAQNPRVRLYSEPELSELDKLTWLVMGRASDNLGRTDTALLQRAALALLAGQGEGGAAGGQLFHALGLDDVAVRQREAGDVRQTVVSLGRQISSRWYVGYERGIGTAAGTWQLIYRLAQRFTLRGQSGEQNSLDVLWTWRWN